MISFLSHPTLDLTLRPLPLSLPPSLGPPPSFHLPRCLLYHLPLLLPSPSQAVVESGLTSSLFDCFALVVPPAAGLLVEDAMGESLPPEFEYEDLTGMRTC